MNFSYGLLRQCSKPLLAVLLLLMTMTAWARPKTDVLYMNNGDRITCEIVNLQKAYLYVKLPYGDGTVSLDWAKVARIESPQSFVITDADGHRYTGTLKKTATQADQLQVELVHNDTTHIFEGNDVVEITRSDTGFWQNQHGSIDFGLSLSKQDNRTQYNFSAADTYEREKWSVGTSYQSNLATGGGSSLRNDVVLNGVRQLNSPRNLALAYNEYLQSDEQDLNLRVTLGGGYGRVFSNSNSARIVGIAGLVLDRERYSTGPVAGQYLDSLEGMLGGQVNLFRFKTLNLLAQALAYPSLTSGPRVRFDFTASSRVRVARDLYWTLNYYLNTDSNPPSSSPKTDYGLSSGLGFTF